MRGIFTLTLAVALSAAFFGVSTAADQPDMQAALQDLYAAKQAIIAADVYNDHGGHAGAATRLIDQAIHQVRLGIAYRDQHGP
jgi:hypothetical protein